MNIFDKHIDCVDEGFVPTVAGFYITANQKVVLKVKIGHEKYYNYILGTCDELKNKVISFE